MITGTVHRSLDIYLIAEENFGKRQLGNHMIKAVRSVNSSNEVPSLSMRSV